MIPVIAAAGVFGLTLSKGVSTPSSTAVGRENKQQVRVVCMPPDQQSNIKSLLIAGSIGAGAMIAIGGIRFISNNEMAERKKEEVMRHKEVKDKLKTLNKNAKIRIRNLDVGIRSEQRAGFRILSNQIQSLSEVAIQTLSEVAKSGDTPGGEGENAEDLLRKREALLKFAKKAQEDSDRLTRENTYEEAVSFYRTKLRANIGGIPGMENPGSSANPMNQTERGCTDMETQEGLIDIRKKRKRKNFYKKLAMGVFGVTVAAVGVSYATSESRKKI